MRSLGFVTLASIACVLPACNPIGQNEFTRFQGDWQMVSFTQGGVSAPTASLQNKVWRFSGNKLISLDNPNDTATITLDATRSPAEINIVDKDGVKDAGIYKFAGSDKFTIAFGSGQRRPTAFESPAGSKFGVAVFERVKK